MGTRGSAALRAEEASRAAESLGASRERTLDFPMRDREHAPHAGGARPPDPPSTRPASVIAPALEGRQPGSSRDGARSFATPARRGTREGGARDSEASAVQDPAQPELPAGFRQAVVPRGRQRGFETEDDRGALLRIAVRRRDTGGEVYPREPSYDVVAHHAAYYGSLIRTVRRTFLHTTR